MACEAEMRFTPPSAKTGGGPRVNPSLKKKNSVCYLSFFFVVFAITLCIYLHKSTRNELACKIGPRFELRKIRIQQANENKKKRKNDVCVKKKGSFVRVGRLHLITVLRLLKHFSTNCLWSLMYHPLPSSVHDTMELCAASFKNYSSPHI